MSWSSSLDSALLDPVQNHAQLEKRRSWTIRRLAYCRGLYSRLSFIRLLLWVRDGHDGAQPLSYASPGQRRAQRSQTSHKTLERPDRLLGVILIGNNFVNFSAASIATLLAIQILGEEGVAWAPVICTFVFLIFAEVAPKTIARITPENRAAVIAHSQPLVTTLVAARLGGVCAFKHLTQMLGIQHQNDQAII